MKNSIANWMVTKNQEKISVCETITNQVYEINELNTEVFINRKLKVMDGIIGDALLCDGYATWLKGDLDLKKELSQFTISTWILPISFEHDAGIISQLAERENKGFSLFITKWGNVLFSIGNGVHQFFMDSKQGCLTRGQWNHVSAVFDGVAGWMFIFINGIEVNRQQVGRKIRLVPSQTACLIGKKYEDLKHRHILNGYLNHLCLYETAFNQAGIYELYQKDLREHGDHIPYVDMSKISVDKADYMNDFQRPKYHLAPNGKWMNEPHGPIYFEGYYHLFYQANQHAPVWNHIQWGHLISKDMVHWQELELALESEKGKIDQDGCWSGTCCVDECGIPTIFYTAGDDTQLPNQMVAVAKSDYLESGDIKLTKWQKQKHPIVKQTQEVGWLGEFRDPFVWKEDHIWYMLIGTGDANNGGGNAVLYTSVDMKDWIYRGFIMNYDFSLCQEVGHVWELPVLLPIRNSKNEITKHILCFCSCQIDDDIVETYYFEGQWDKENYRFIKDHELPKLIDLGYGTFTGGSGFVTPDKRSVFFTIAQGKRHFIDEYCSGWAHNGGLPIELFAHEEGCLGVRPIKELENLRRKKHLDIESVSLHDVNEQLKLIKSNMLELKVTVVLDQSEFGLGVCYDEGKRLHVYYEKQFCKYGVRNELGEIGRYRGEIDQVEVNSNQLTFTMYLDHSMVEVFLNEKKSMTLRQYSNQNNRSLKLFGEANQLIEKIEVWELDAI